MKHELPTGFVKDVVGYCDPLSVLPGDSVRFKLSAWNEAIDREAGFEVVKLISGDDRPHGTGLIETPVCSLPPAAIAHQPLRPGSHARVRDVEAEGVEQITIHFFPTLLREASQTLLHWGDLRVSVSEGHVRAAGSDGELSIDVRLTPRRWHTLTLRRGAPSLLLLTCHGEGVAEVDWLRTDEGDWPGVGAGGDLYFARSPGEVPANFNGRLESPALSDANGEVARWDFSREMDSQSIMDVVGDHHGHLLQCPTRCVRGLGWDGSAQSAWAAPAQYGAIHFHEDDLTDAGWEDTLSWAVPEALESGQYALKVTVGDSEDYVPFFVRAPEGSRAKLAYLVPTASYLAYANQRLAFSGGIFGAPKFYDANQAFLFAHEDVGYSLYEYHRDRSGVHFSSRLRPILNMKPRNPTWAFNADTHVTAWLDHLGETFDVLTDEDLHREGAGALAGYRCVITGSHPEYYSTEMLDGLETWLADGGRLMYMGGNGFYWRVAFQRDNPAVMEVRRAEDGTRAWIAEPGEYYHQFSGEYGGLWRRLGRPPNRLVGIGFAAQGFDGGTYYRIGPGALDPRVEFALEGVSETDCIGDYGNQGGGAAGEEIDRWDPSLGSPAHAVIIASSENHRPGMLRVKEEYHMMEPPDPSDEQVRADMVFFEVPGGGAVFSTGSISYAGSLAHDRYENDIARLTGNVLRRFLDETPFDMPA